MRRPPFQILPPPASPLDLFASPDRAGARAALDRLHRAGGRPLLVGGCVRDLLLTGRGDLADLDVEVQGLDPDLVKEILLGAGGREHGRSFAVLQLDGVEFSLPRRERKTGPGHRGFAVDLDPHMPYPEASARRDLTINSMALDLHTGELLDPHGGRVDLAAGILRHTSPRFIEDPLRVLRVMQFAGRLAFSVAPATISLCRQIRLDELPPERLWGEWRKLLLKGIRPSLGLEFLRHCGAINHFPELAALIETEQDPGWHPEGTVWEHTLLCLDAAAGLRSCDPDRDLAVMLGVLCHDLGKPATTRWDPDRSRVVSPRHEPEGEAPTRSFLARLTRESHLVDLVVQLVRRHLAPHEIHKIHQHGKDCRPALRRLALRVDPLLLERVARADHLGRHTEDARAGDYPAGDFFLSRVEELELARRKPQPLVLGRHLIPLGVKPGPALGRLLERLFQAQLEGEFATLEEGLDLFHRQRASWQES